MNVWKILYHIIFIPFNFREQQLILLGRQVITNACSAAKPTNYKSLFLYVYIY